MRFEGFRWLASDAPGRGGAGLRERASYIMLDPIWPSDFHNLQHTKRSRVLLDISFLSIGEIILAPVDIPGAD